MLFIWGSPLTSYVVAGDSVLVAPYWQLQAACWAWEAPSALVMHADPGIVDETIAGPTIRDRAPARRTPDQQHVYVRSNDLGVARPSKIV